MKFLALKMSILLKDEIHEFFKAKQIVIEPFNFDQLGPNSYDVKLGNTLKVYTEFPLDPKKENKTENIIIPKEGLVLQPGKLYLGHTIEKIGSKYFIPMYEGRSSMARLGIESHLSAGFGDIGFINQWTLEIVVVHPIIVYPEMKIGQIYFHKINPDVNQEENQYKGKYSKQEGPTESKSHLDYN